MAPADKALLRLGIGIGLAVLAAYGLGLPVPYVAPVLAVVLLCKPGPPIPLFKGVVLGAVIAALLASGLLMVPLLEHYRLSGVLLTAVVLYLAFLAGARKPNPLTTFVVVACTIIPVAGVAEQALAIALAQALGLGLGTAIVVTAVSHALFPDPPPPAAAAAPPPAVDAQAARRSALQATLVILPVFVVALTNPALYLAAIMKTVMLGQQAGATNARSAGRELVGSTLMGALIAAVVWAGLTLRPNLWMLMLWVMAAAFWCGARLFRVKASRYPPSFWLNALMTMFIVMGPGIEDAAAGKDVYAAAATRVLLFIAISFYAWGLVWLLERWRGRSAAPA